MSHSELAAGTCEPCENFGSPLPAERVEELAGDVPDWQVRSGTKLTRLFRLANFREAFSLATRIALLAEEQGHHPDLAIGWGRLEVALTTHALKGLSPNDFVMAARIDDLAASAPLKT